MPRKPYYKRYPGDYLADTGHLELEDHGLYNLCLDYLYLNFGKISEEKLRKSLKISPKKWQKKFKKISFFFQIENGTITHKRVKIEIDKYMAKCEKNAENAKKGAEARWSKDAERHSDKPEKNMPNGIANGIKKNAHIINHKPETRSNIRVFELTSEPFILSEFFFEKLKELNPDMKTPNLQVWAKAMDKIIRIDKRTPDQIREKISTAVNHHFWCKNILSPDKLRKQWDRLTLEERNHGNLLQGKTGKYAHLG